MLPFDYRDDMPTGASALLPGFVLLLVSVFVYAGPPPRPASYHTLLTVHGVVAEVRDGRRMHVSIDTLGGAAPPAQVDVTDPELDSARARMSSLPLGERVVVQFDPITQIAWRLERGDGKAGFGDREISRWQWAEGGATAHRHAAWLLAAGVVALVFGFVVMNRSVDAEDPLDFTPHRDRSLMP